MELTDLIGPEAVAAGMRANSKKQFLQEIAKRASKITGIDERDIFDVLIEREKLGTTGIGQGIAIPHGKLPNLDRLYGFFVKLERPIDFDSIDEQPVDLVCLLLAPETAGADHLKALARVSRFLRNASTCEKLRGTESDDGIYALLSADTTTSHAA